MDLDIKDWCVGVAFDDRALFHETGYFEQSLRFWEFTERIWEKHSIQGLPFRQRTPSMVFHPATPKPRPCEKDGQDSVYHDRRPQQGSDPFTTDADVSEIGCRQSAVDQHADQRRARPAGDPQSDQGDAGHLSYRNRNSGELGAEQ